MRSRGIAWESYEESETIYSVIIIINKAGRWETYIYRYIYVRGSGVQEDIEYTCIHVTYWKETWQVLVCVVRLFRKKESAEVCRDPAVSMLNLANHHNSYSNKSYHINIFKPITS